MHERDENFIQNFGTLRRRWEDNIRMDPREKGCEGTD
jgi:hypothetical protein